MDLEQRLAALEGRVGGLYDVLDDRFSDLRRLLENELAHQARGVDELRAWRQQINGWRAEQAGKVGKLEGRAWITIGVLASLVSAMVSGILQIAAVLAGVGR